MKTPKRKPRARRKRAERRKPGLTLTVTTPLHPARTPTIEEWNMAPLPRIEIDQE